VNESYEERTKTFDQLSNIDVVVVSFKKTLNEYLFMGTPPSKIYGTFAASAVDLKPLATIFSSKVDACVGCQRPDQLFV